MRLFLRQFLENDACQTCNYCKRQRAIRTWTRSCQRRNETLDKEEKPIRLDRVSEHKDSVIEKIIVDVNPTSNIVSQCRHTMNWRNLELPKELQLLKAILQVA